MYTKVRHSLSATYNYTVYGFLSDLYILYFISISFYQVYRKIDLYGSFLKIIEICTQNQFYMCFKILSYVGESIKECRHKISWGS